MMNPTSTFGTDPNQKLERRDQDDRQFSQDAAGNKPPRSGLGLAENPLDPGVTTSNDPIEKVAGAGPAVARHSKDAQPKQP